MSRENVARVQGALEHFATTGEPPWNALHGEVEVHDHDIMDASDYRGHEGFRHWLDEQGLDAVGLDA